MQTTTSNTANSEDTAGDSLSGKKPGGQYSAEAIIVGVVSVITVLLVNAPWLLGCLVSQPPEKTFIGAVYNITDFENYMAWLQQTSHGAIILHNLFTTLPQNPKQINFFFILLGLVVRLTGIDPAVLYQLVRAFAGIGLLALGWRFIRYCFPERADARIASFCFLCFGNGFGWTTAHRWADVNLANTPIEAWQPEAYTFQSMETSTLFCVSIPLILASMAFLLVGENRRQMRWAVYAGLCLAVLGNIHSYDVLHVTAAWTLYLIVRTAMLRNQEVLQSWARAVVALAIMLPTTLYVFYAFRVDPIFHARAEVKTLSKPLSYYLEGYAPMLVLALVFAAAFAVLWIKSKRSGEPIKLEQALSPFKVQTTALVVICWAVAGLAVSYLGTPGYNLHTSHPWFPFAWNSVAFQRKMLMGEHIPLCLLGGAGASCCVRYLRGWIGWLPFAALFAVSVPSAVLFMNRDVNHIMTNRSESSTYWPFIDKDTWDYLTWIKQNTQFSDPILGIPTISGIIPAETGRPVWSGHWSETPNFTKTVSTFEMLVDMNTPDDARQAFLAQSKAKYLVIPRESLLAVAMPTRATTDFSQSTPPYLTLVHSNDGYLIYKVNLPPIPSS